MAEHDIRTAPRHSGAGAALIELPSVADERGSLMFAETGRHVPFAIERVFALYNTAPGQHRGRHAHKTLFECCIAVSGSCRIHIDDARERRTFVLDRPTAGLVIPPRLWCELTDFSEGAVCLVLASAPFDEGDYIRDYAEFQRTVGQG